jgi:hypothetical protein
MKVLLWESPPDRTPSAAIIHARTSARREHYEVAGPGRRGDMLVKLAAADRIMVIGARDDSLSQFARELLRWLAGR